MLSRTYSKLLDFIETYDIKINHPKLSPCISNSISYINKNLSMQLSATDLSKKTFVSKSTIEKRFRRELGLSVHEYVFDAVMLKASQLLRSSDMSIHDISESLGFCDQFYFSKCFKEKFRKSPREFRNSQTI